MARQRVKTTKMEIIRCATELFLEQGYSATSAHQIAKMLDISTGNLTYYFPTKEHLLAELTDILCKFQWKMMEEEADDGISSLMAICLELTGMAVACETDEIIKEFYLSTYTSPLCLSVIRKNDMERAKEVYGSYCPDWTDEQFVEAEILVSGIEYATLMTSGEPASLETRIAGALNAIMQIYQIPADTRGLKVARVLAMDYRAIAKRMTVELKQFVAQTNQHALEDLYAKRED